MTNRAVTIKQKLISRHLTAAQIARDLHVTKGAVSNVINGQYYVPKIAQAVADAVGVDHDALWTADEIAELRAKEVLRQKSKKSAFS